MKSNKYYQMCRQSLSEEEKRLSSFLSIVAAEGISEQTVFQVLQPGHARDFHASIEKLYLLHWITLDHHTIVAPPQTADFFLKMRPINEPTIEKVLGALDKLLPLRPQDDMLAKQEYFVLARLFLEHLLAAPHRRAVKKSHIAPLFAAVVIFFVSNFELSLCGNKRQPVAALEDRLDYRLLKFVTEINSDNGRTGHAYRLLGELYTNIFRYGEAKACFQETEALLGPNAQLWMAQARMYENLGIFSRAFQLAYRAYLFNKGKNWGEDNIPVCLYLSYLCASSQAAADSKVWRNKACALLGMKEVPPCHFVSITLKEIEALVHQQDTALAHQIADAAELEIVHLYGGGAPELARLAFIRCVIDEQAGLDRKSMAHYADYVHFNHANYGFSVGDQAVLYAGIIFNHIQRGNTTTAAFYSAKMQALYAEGDNIAPGVRFNQAIANYLSHSAEVSYSLCETYLETAVEIYEKELKPDDALLAEIAPVFHNGKIPASVMEADAYKTIHLCTIHHCMAEGRIGDAKAIIGKLTRNEEDALERQKWAVQLGRALIAEGKRDTGLRVWNKTLEKVSKASRFEIAKEMAEWADHFNLHFDSLHFYEEALQRDTMAYGNSRDIVEALQCYAHELEQCGLEEISDEPWKQALTLAQSTGDKDGIALLYFTWSATKQGHEAEVLLEKAISHWTPEPSLFDETLAKMYFSLACVQAQQGYTEAFEATSLKAMALCPGDISKECVEEMLGPRPKAE